MNLSFKNRIALYYTVATAAVTGGAFFLIFWVVQITVYQTLDTDLAYEAHKHTGEIHLVGDSIVFTNKAEWQEREHREAQVNPVFIQIVGTEGQLMDKSPNLKENKLAFHIDHTQGTHFDAKINDQAIRQVQISIQRKGILKGYIITAMSQESALEILSTLKKTLLFLFPIVTLGLFVASRLIAGKSIAPVTLITTTTDRIYRNNLQERVPLPNNQDELHILSSSINALLNRIQQALEREKQFTADASHQLRTPLAVLKGTLEVLIRKPRTEVEYQEKIQTSILEINRISAIVDKLLVLARFDKNTLKVNKETLDLRILVDEVLKRFSTALKEKELTVKVKAADATVLCSDPYYIDLILENVIGNAIKYSPAQARIEINMFIKDQRLTIEVKDQGPGINKTDLQRVFDPFFRGAKVNPLSIKGSGLGLSIVKKATEVLDAEISLSSEVGRGTSVLVTFHLPYPDEEIQS